MFYAKEYVYGKVAQNNGPHADRFLQFRTREARAVWIEAGEHNDFTASGYREAIGASDARGAEIVDGDAELIYS
jgi:hypothetical protein